MANERELTEAERDELVELVRPWLRAAAAEECEPEAPYRLWMQLGGWELARRARAVVAPLASGGP